MIQVVMFFITLIVGGAKYDGAFVKGNNMLGPSAITFYYMGGKWEPDVRAGQVWRLITPVFLHGVSVCVRLSDSIRSDPIPPIH